VRNRFQVLVTAGQGRRSKQVRILPEKLLTTGSVSSLTVVAVTQRLKRRHERKRGAMAAGDADRKGVELRKDRYWNGPMISIRQQATAVCVPF
jgi:hypothetical protein